MKMNNKEDYRVRRHYRLRKKISGTAARPRMSVFLSNSHIYVQFIDDEQSRTLADTSTMKPGQRSGEPRANVAKAEAMGREAARVAKEKGISEVVFDRGGFRYSGRVKALAEAARAEGLKF